MAMGIEDQSSDVNLFHLFRFTSSLLPIGSFAYSQGLESAIESGWLKSEEDVCYWLTGILTEVLPYNDLAILIRQADALSDDDFEAFCSLNNMILALRESHELLLEDIQLGRTFKTLLNDVDSDLGRQEYLAIEPLSYVSAFAVSLSGVSIGRRELASAYIWSWLENQVSAAIKLVPLGQSQGQRITKRIIDRLADVIETTLAVKYDDIGASAPALAIASSWHETQYSRLFRS